MFRKQFHYHSLQFCLSYFFSKRDILYLIVWPGLISSSLTSSTPTSNSTSSIWGALLWPSLLSSRNSTRTTIAWRFYPASQIIRAVLRGHLSRYHTCQNLNRMPNRCEVTSVLSEIRICSTIRSSLCLIYLWWKE